MAEATVQPNGVVVTAPGVDRNLELDQADEALAAAVLPGIAALDVGGYGVDRGNPLARAPWSFPSFRSGTNF
jgi:hypothetical protein